LTSLRARLSLLGRLGGFLLFPSDCEICRTPLVGPGERVVCRACLDGLKMTHSPFCLCCGRFFDGSGDSHLCAACLERRPSFARHRSVARYEGVLKDIILAYKYRGFEVLAGALGDFIIRSLGREEGLWSGLEAIVPIPLHPAKERKRGFNQARLLARRLSQWTNVPLVNRRLVKVRPTPAQTSLEALARERNLKAAFRVRKPAGLAGKVVLLVDDVYTTGSTLRECSRELRRAGVKEVRAVTLAHA
jgi:competence protein ComFC